jgi:hypothetical protein
VLTSIHQYGSWPPFQRIETKFGLHARNSPELAKKKILLEAGVMSRRNRLATLIAADQSAGL